MALLNVGGTVIQKKREKQENRLTSPKNDGLLKQRSCGVNEKARQKSEMTPPDNIWLLPVTTQWLLNKGWNRRNHRIKNGEHG